ncbi:mannose/glucose-specific lectin-like [Cornus florida]|uniref:mannose/glucose-specific lectin-like n=1 Tax=Cornus florida TaxID=4283 RepID=UPI0028A06701|nr:mannose/glucose-specific lectin-like [Cornus florida]
MPSSFFYAQNSFFISFLDSSFSEFGSFQKARVIHSFKGNMSYINGCYNIGNLVTGYVGSGTEFKPMFGCKGQGAKDRVYEVIKFGPYGGNKGIIFDDVIDKVKELVKVKKLTIFTDNGIIKSFEIEYEYKGISKPIKHGGEGGTASEPAKLGDSECLISMTVCVGKSGDDDVVTSLTFKTNLGNQFGPYGKPTETSYTSPTGHGNIIGFFGRSDEYVNQIGAYFLKEIKP